MESNWIVAVIAIALISLGGVALLMQAIGIVGVILLSIAGVLTGIYGSLTGSLPREAYNSQQPPNSERLDLVCEKAPAAHKPVPKKIIPVSRDEEHACLPTGASY